MSKSRPTRDRLLDMFHIDVDRGEIVWKKSQGRARAGSIAGNTNVHGYRRIHIDGAEYLAHAVIFFIAHGEWPELIDHINGVRDDNRIANLRQADSATNARNRHAFLETKLPGAQPYGAGKFAAVITADGKQYRLGVFDTELQAHQTYLSARAQVQEAERQARTAMLERLHHPKASQ